jgi:hypothetical protein
MISELPQWIHSIVKINGLKLDTSASLVIIKQVFPIGLVVSDSHSIHKILGPNHSHQH